MNSLTISQLARRSGVPVSTLRYYEKVGVCSFYAFTLRVDGPTRQLDISAGPGGEPAVRALVGLEQ